MSDCVIMITIKKVEKRRKMKEQNIETKILLLLCMTFWVFQSVGETQRMVVAGIFSMVMIATTFLSNKTREQYHCYIIAGFVQCISFWMMMVFEILKENKAVNLINVRIALVIFFVLFICIILPVWMTKKKLVAEKIQRVGMKYWIGAAMLAGYILRQFQVFLTSVVQQQNDIGTFSEGSLGIWDIFTKFTNIQHCRMETQWSSTSIISRHFPILLWVSGRKLTVYLE